MKPDISPATADVHRIRLSSTPLDRRNNHDARRLSAPVWSRPAPRIIVAMMLITAFPENPENNSSAGTSRATPSATNTTKAVASTRMRGNMNMTIVNTTSPSTSIMSRVRIRSVPMVGGIP